MVPNMDRPRRLLQTVESRWVAAAAILVLALALGAFLRLGVVPPQQAAGQEGTGQETTEETTTPVPQYDDPLPPAPDPGEDFLGALEEQYAPEEEPAGIPGLSAMDVVGGVGEAPPGVTLSCFGPNPERGEVYSWRCHGAAAGAPREDGARAEYRVEVIAVDPRTILSVTASAYRATDEEAAEFLVYVAELAVEDPAPLDAQVWVRGNLAAGGATFADGAGLELYGYEGARVLEVVATG